MYRSASVPIPTTGGLKFRSNNTGRYVYKKLGKIKKANGKWEEQTEIIGRIDPYNPKMMIPNKNFARHFPNNVQYDTENSINNLSLEHNSNPASNMDFVKIIHNNKLVLRNKESIPWIHRSVGCCRVLRYIANECGLESILKSVFPNNWMEIMYIAFDMLCNGNIMTGINARSERILSNLILLMDDNRCSELFAEITEYQKLKFFELWTKHIDEDCMQYDITSIDCCGDNIDEAKVGRTSAKKGIKQINLAFLFGHNSKLPISYEVLQGNMPDKKTLINMINFTQQISKKIIMFILDQGFETEENLRYMHENKYNFIIPLSYSRTDNKKLLEKFACKVYQHKNRIHKFQTYGLTVDVDIYDIPVNAHLYFNLSKAEREDDVLENKLIKYEEEIAKFKNVSELKKIPQKFSKYFELVNATGGKKSIIRDNNKIIKLSSRHGFFILITTDKNLSSEEVLSIYKKKDCIGQNYYALKHGIDITKLSTHENNTSNGKLFVAYIALIIRTYIHQKKKDSKELKFLRMSFPEILRQLSLIDLCVNNGIPSVIGIGPSQMRIIENLKISPNLFIDDFLPVFLNGEIPIKISL
jgi:transposase